MVKFDVMDAIREAIPMALYGNIGWSGTLALGLQQCSFNLYTLPLECVGLNGWLKESKDWTYSEASSFNALNTVQRSGIWVFCWRR